MCGVALGSRGLKPADAYARELGRVRATPLRHTTVQSHLRQPPPRPRLQPGSSVTYHPPSALWRNKHVSCTGGRGRGSQPLGRDRPPDDGQQHAEAGHQPVGDDLARRVARRTVAWARGAGRRAITLNLALNRTRTLALTLSLPLTPTLTLALSLPLARTVEKTVRLGRTGGRVRALGALERGALEEHRRREDVDDGRAGECA